MHVTYATALGKKAYWMACEMMPKPRPVASARKKIASASPASSPDTVEPTVTVSASAFKQTLARHVQFHLSSSDQTMACAEAVIVALYLPWSESPGLFYKKADRCTCAGDPGTAVHPIADERITDFMT